MLLTAATARAQDAASESRQESTIQSDNDIAEEAIIVTGTLIRGIAPTGTNVIGVNRAEIVESGVSSSTDLLANIPQLSYFGSVPRANSDRGSPVFFPNLRNLGATGGQNTLMLVDGRRLVGQGILSSTPDPTIIPPVVIERVDVIPDGGSSIYGSDAIGGVINFITRRRFNGVEAGARYGFADSYQQADGDIIAGKDWGTGSLYVAYAYAWHSNLYGADRDYMTSNHLDRGGSDLRSTACSPGNILIGTTTYALPGRVAGTINRCDEPKQIDVYPQEERHSVFASLTQELAPGIEFNATAYWSQRKTDVKTAQSSTSGTITAANPYFRPIGTETSHNVAFSFADVFGPSNVSRQNFQSAGITAGMNFDVGGRWQLRTLANFGRSHSEIREELVNVTAITAALNGTTLAAALNPYNPGASNPAVLAAIDDFENHDTGVQELAEGRIVAEGPLFAIGGGDVRLALGAEYHYNNLKQTLIPGPKGTLASAPGTTRAFSSRNVKSLFGEIVVPLFGSANGAAGLRSLTLSGSVRYDDYSDVGGTTNPKVGITWKPFDDLTIRGNYGTSFHAPGLEATSGLGQQAQILPISPFRQVGSPITDLFRPTIILAGGNPNLKPETATTFSAGFDWKPDAVPGLLASATYYKVDFKDAIGLISAATLFTDPNFASFYTINPTLAQARAATAGMQLVGVSDIALLYVGRSPYLLADARLNNFGALKTDGVDFHLNYTRPVGKVTLMADLAGNYVLNRDFSTGGSKGPFTNTLKNGTGRLFFVGTLGGKVGDFTGRAVFNYRGGYPIQGLVGQTRIKSFQTVDLRFSWDVPAGGVLAGTQLTLNIDNLLDVDPAYANLPRTNFAQFNGSTLGRMVQLGIRKTF
ncbi:TonB-dependent receptor [Sphingopyxis sp. CCNWLW253]|uniref:TonB-dependent receptor domain-containing protein n=1 Tax=unclassified Sphingopyxis TaxID=2614943 RepID=UPI003012A670